MRQSLRKILKVSSISQRFLIGALISLLIVIPLLPSSAARLADRLLMMTTSEIGATAEYQLSFGLPSSGQLGSIVVQVCSNDPNPMVTCIVPTGFDISNAVLSSQTGPGGFLISPGATTNRLVLSRAPAIANAGPASFNFTQVVNPTNPGSYYIRILTYASADASGPYIDEGGIAFAATNSLSVTATVPPYLTFCTGLTITGLNCANAEGDYIDFGELSSTKASSGSSQMLAATNAIDGYNVSVTGTTMTSGVNSINAMASNDVSRPGTPQFGFNLKANSTPAGGSEPTGPGAATPLLNYGQSNRYRFVDGESLVTIDQPDDVRLFTASYIVNVPKTQAPGIYVTTLTYICLGTF